MILHLHGNPCCDDEHYRLQLVLNLKNLRVRGRCHCTRCRETRLRVWRQAHRGSGRGALVASQVLDKSKVAPDERRLLQSVLGLPVDESSSEEEEDSADSDGSEDAGAPSADVARDESKSGGAASGAPRLPQAEVDALPTDPEEVIRVREAQKKRAGTCAVAWAACPSDSTR